MGEQDLTKIVTDELIYMREQARLNKNFTLSDQIRDELDSRQCFVMDTPNGQVAYHLIKGYTRPRFLEEMEFIDYAFQR